MRRLLLLIVVLPALASADERILRFHSDIRVMSDGWIEVTEEITVRSEGHRIRRGIYRDLQTEYFDRGNNRVEVTFEPLVVTRNEARENYHVVYTDDGIRVYFGHRSRYLDNGVHRYVFRYRASRMLGFFEDHDELYWNVTGFDWQFPIDLTSARVSLDFDVARTDIGYEAYTGPLYGTGSDYVARIEDGDVFFDATRPSSALNGMTIVVTWPKGHVEEPSALQRFAWRVKDNASLFAALAGLALLFAYYIPVWRRHGRDPEEGVVVTRYQPPDGFSPASLRYIRQMYYDDKVMSAAVVNLAVKGYLSIAAEDDDEHTLMKTDPGPDAEALAPGEQELYDVLFMRNETIRLHHDNHMILGSAKSAHQSSLKDDYKQNYFRTNGLLNVPGMAIVILSTIIAVNLGRGVTISVIATVITMFLVMAFFAIIMKRPTLRGRKVLDQMLGFQDYLEVAEKDELNLRNPPEKTPELFEAYLPYALALGVEQEWAEKFTKVLASIRGDDGGQYHPAWYHGSFSVNNLGSTTSSLSSGLSSAISSSVMAPGSTSGAGGGGFSGGGGGGGGGGGW